MASRGGQRAARRRAPLAAFAGGRSGAVGRAQRGMSRAASHARRGDATPPSRRRRCWSALRDAWAALPAQAVRRLSAAPFSLFDAGFASAPRWLELRTRGVHDQSQRRAGRISSWRGALHHAAHAGLRLAPRAQPARAACLVFGSTFAAVESLAACSLVVRSRPRPIATPEMLAPALVRIKLRLLARVAGRRVGRAPTGSLHELLLGGVPALLPPRPLAAHPVASESRAKIVDQSVPRRRADAHCLILHRHADCASNQGYPVSRRALSTGRCGLTADDMKLRNFGGDIGPQRVDNANGFDFDTGFGFVDAQRALRATRGF